MFLLYSLKMFFRNASRVLFAETFCFRSRVNYRIKNEIKTEKDHVLGLTNMNEDQIKRVSIY